jgi:menaquinone-9 beta-reductase
MSFFFYFYQNFKILLRKKLFKANYKHHFMLETKVCIIGAGPGGVATALRLAQLGIPSVLVDKAKFPRDKVCGDGMTGRTVALLNRIDPSIIETFDKQPYQTDSWGVTFWADNKREFNVPFKKSFDKINDKKPCYVSKRMDFDNHLVEYVRKQPLITFLENTSIDKHEKVADGWVLSNKKGDFEVKTTLVIAANGANSPFTRHAANIAVDPKHSAASVRAYYKNVTGFHKDNFIEIHFLKNYLPGYFWIFPLPNGESNVGLGILTADVSKKKMNLKKVLLEIIETQPGIKERFQNATLVDDIIGFPLPFGSKRRILSGDNYMLVGDAASLVDPLTGEGIGNAIYSGMIAAEQAEKCFEVNDFSTEILKEYDKRIWRVMGTELNLSYRLQRLGNFPLVFNFVLWMASRNVQISDLVYSMFNNIDVRKKILSPFFWFKMLVNAK